MLDYRTTAYLFYAGEWISGATCNYIANFLTENYDNNEEVTPTFSSLMLCESSVVNCHVLSLQVTNLLRSVEFIFVPFVNPDGYVVSLHLPCSLSLLFLLFVVMVALSHLQYSWSDDRLWRKNSRKGILCNGVDLNRNYNSKWGGVSYPASFLIRLCMINTMQQ